MVDRHTVPKEEGSQDGVETYIDQAGNRWIISPCGHQNDLHR
jgi:hypothetical protein